MLWLCIFLSELPLECLNFSSAQVAVIEHQHQRRWITTCSADCAQHGIQPGLDVVSALARLPTLQLIERSFQQEHESLKALAAWAGQFSDVISFDRQRLLLWMELSHSLKLFGGLTSLRKMVATQLSELHYSARFGVGPCIEASALLTKVSHQHVVLETSSILPRIEPLPLHLLAVANATKEALRDSGLRTIGDVYRLGFNALARRFGQALCDYLRQLIGQMPDPKTHWKAPDRYARRMAFLSPIENIETLQFPIRRLLNELQGFLIGRDRALQEMQITLEHEDVPATTLRIRSSRPQRDAAQLHMLVRERLQRTVIASPALALTMNVLRLVAFDHTQMDLFGSAQGGETAWLSLLDKMCARFGEEAVKTLALQEHHRPENAWCVADGKPSSVMPVPLPDRPLWLLPSPQSHEAPHQILSLPERIEEGWWEGRDHRRDYFLAEARDGGRLWLYQDADDRRWYLHGIWA